MPSLSPGRPKSDPFALEPLGLRELGQTGSEANKANAPAMKKSCPVCNSDNGPNEVSCVNCGARLTGKQQMVNRSPSQKGQQTNGPSKIISQVVMPTNSKVVTRDMPESMNRRIKRVPHRELSDEFVDSVHDEHLDQVQRSADNLGL